MLPLAGITVVSLEVAVAAPFASRQLADLGARVIKVERPGVGDFARGYDQEARGLSSHFVWTNRSKESLTLNLKTEAGKQILKKLLKRADVFIHNLGPGAVDRLGFSAERLVADNPQLINCAISGYGASGPYREKKAYDLLIQAEAGFLSLTGTPETPSKAGVSVADIAAGMYAYSGILTALLTRHQTGSGSTIEVSMLEALGEWMGFPLYYALGGKSPRRHGASHASIAPYGPFAAGDGGYVILGVQNEYEWQRFCETVLQRPALAKDERFAGNPHRVAHRHVLQELIEDVFCRSTRSEIISRLEQAGIANAEMRTMEMFLDHPQLAARERWREVSSPAGDLPALLPPATMSGVKPVFKPIPALGEHTDAILTELGYEEADIAQLRADQVL
ncbi:MAG: CoA transferase [Chloroflexota bacterium]|nr:MAG: CoA transferase [Chloroflexota bacterium]